jgi:predicted dehydrogenase
MVVRQIGQSEQITVNPIKIAQIGCGHPHSAAHLGTFTTLKEVRSIVLCDPDAAAAEKLRQKAPGRVEAVVGNLDAALARDDVQFVNLCLPNDETPDAIARAARAGKHIMSEKPCAVSAEALKPALDEVARAKAGFLVHFTNRYRPDVREMVRLIRAGAIGRLTSVETRMVTTQPKFRDPKHWLFKRARTGGGILAWLACHYIDLARVLTAAEVASVAAQCATTSAEAIDVEDTAVCAFRFTNGALGSLHAGYLLARGTAGYIMPGYDAYIAVRGTEGALVLEPFHSPQDSLLHISTTHQVREQPFTYSKGEGYGGEYGQAFVRDFINAAQRGEPSPAGADAALATRRILDACYASSSAGRTISVNQV